MLLLFLVDQIYTYVRNSTFDVRRAEITARLLTGTYTLQSNRARFNQFNVDPICPLCKREPETREHFIVTCESLKDVRTPYLVKLRTLFDNSSGIDDILKSPELSVQLLLDSSHPRITNSLNISDKQTEQIELHSRELIYVLHLKRSKLLESL